MKEGNYHASMTVVPRRYSASLYYKELGLARRVSARFNLSGIRFNAEEQILV
jgi:hypothetical protein